ncbi:hypothetical protein [Pajaroellobacter abortibovis]|uniref:Gamma-glutamyltransferase n=1 Tax=Pajaroellobacter abortibovis TaxID=1882918 RepID=A0A1L6MX52_9BACT|nr:hypothetical protein [Pajaroellobacter abortibovis]APS00130.1 hypothetical protein BCY86_05135 [Pajaroellobacter abortibovis]
MKKINPFGMVMASQEIVQAVATDVLRRGNAIDALVAGLFSACAHSPSVLLGPVQILMGGVGLGVQAVDGRVRQPGLGTRRPRGFQPADSIPKAAYVGVPCFPGALAAALAIGGTLSWSAALSLALKETRFLSRQRISLLQQIVHRGPLVFSEAGIASAFVDAFGKIAGGLITREDMEQVRPLILRGFEKKTKGSTLFPLPWSGEEYLPAPAFPSFAGLRRIQIVGVADRWGLTAVACYEEVEEGIPMLDFDLIAPPLAAPVLRGWPRAKPGTPRSAEAPIFLRETDGLVDLVVGVEGTPEEIAKAQPLLEQIGGTAASLRPSDTVGGVLREGHERTRGKFLAIACLRGETKGFHLYF